MSNHRGTAVPDLIASIKLDSLKDFEFFVVVVWFLIVNIFKTVGLKKSCGVFCDP